MATQAYPFFQITDGTTSCTIQDGSGGATNYPLVRDGWAPSVAGLRASPLTGYTPYEDVVETFTIEINGATATAALANLATLTKLLDQAARWYRGENVTAVLLKIAPHGSTVSSTAAPLQAAILGGSVRAPNRFDEVGRNFVIPNVEVSVLRRGLWLFPGGDDTGSPSAANNGEIITADLGASSAVDILSPTKVVLTNFGYEKSTASRFLGGFLLIGAASAVPFVIYAAEDLATGVYTSVAGGLNARNTNVLRFTPAGTTEVDTATVTGSALDSFSDLLAVFINVKPSATVSFSVRAKFNSGISNQYTPRVTIPANSAQYPYWVFLGMFPKNGGVRTVGLAVTAASASSSLDIDSIVVCDARATQVLGLIGPGDSDPNNADAFTATLNTNHRLTTDETPAAFLDSLPVGYTTAPVSYLGDAVFMTKERYVYGLLLATGGGTGSTGQEFRQANVSTDVVLQNTWTITRTPGYLVPQ